MIRSQLAVVPLEDRTTPSSGTGSEGTTTNVSCPPTDPMDDPPPAQPSKPGGGSSSGNGNGNGNGNDNGNGSFTLKPVVSKLLGNL